MDTFTGLCSAESKRLGAGIGVVMLATALLAGCAAPTEAGVAKERGTKIDAAPVEPAREVRRSVEVAARFVEVRDAGPMSPEELRKLMTAGRGSRTDTGAVLGVLSAEETAQVWKKLSALRGVEVVSSPRVTAATGNSAKIGIGEEIRYPARWDKTAEGLVPGEFTTRTIGVELAATSELEADGRLRVEAKPTWTVFDGFLELGALAPKFAKEELVTIGGKPVSDDKRAALAPVFSVRELATKVRLRSGETVVLLAPEKKTGTAAESFVLVTAVLVPVAGK